APTAAADGTVDIYGANGEVIVDTKDGVQYVLRFGEIAPQLAPTGPAKKDPKDKAKADDEQVKVHRYLFVSTRLAPSVTAEPIYEPLPAGPEPTPESKPAEEKKEGEAAKAEEKQDTPKGDDEKKAPIVDPQQAERERIK